MKLSNLSKAVGAGVLTLSLAVLPSALPASAQTNSETTSPAPGAMEGGAQTQGINSAETGDRDFDWGWLGLIGLAGLAGLSRKRDEPARYRDPGTTGTH